MSLAFSQLPLISSTIFLSGDMPHLYCAPLPSSFCGTVHLCALSLLPENWIHLLVGVEPIDRPKPKIGGRKDLLFAASKENTGDISQSSVSPNSKSGEVFS